MTDWMKNPPEGCCLESCEPMTTWVVLMAGPEAALHAPSFYKGKTFRIEIRFTEKYPLEPPEVRQGPQNLLSLARVTMLRVPLRCLRDAMAQPPRPTVCVHIR